MKERNLYGPFFFVVYTKKLCCLSLCKECLSIMFFVIVVGLTKVQLQVAFADSLACTFPL